jgi:hypothetical protein
MKIVALKPMAPGRPGQHLGVSHLIKHWLAPAEYFSDLALEVLPEKVAVHPASLADMLAAAGETSPHTRPAREPGPAIAACWNTLAQAQAEGYDAVVQACFDGFFDGTLSASGPVVRHGRQRPAGSGAARVGLALPGGIIVIGDVVRPPAHHPLAGTSDAFALAVRTAFRPKLGGRTDHRHTPNDAGSRAQRRALAELLAQRNLLAHTSGDDHD